MMILVAQQKQEYQAYINILNKELMPALGCTEPIAVAYAAAKARQVLGVFPEKIEIRCSGNIIKNVKGVMVPNSGGLCGIDVAAVLGVVGGNADRELEVLEEIQPEHIVKAKELIAQGFFTCELQENVANLYIVATVVGGGHTASVTIIDKHNLITEIQKDGEVIYHVAAPSETPMDAMDWPLSFEKILDFARNVDTARVQELLDRQITMNTAISQTGLKEVYGAQVGRTLLDVYGDDVRTRARAWAAAGSDARMGGCSLPVVINSGSGNQGMTVSLPVIVYAQEWQVPQETLYRALLISNLISIHLKHYIGSLSAFCGAVTAASGAGAAITFMAGGTDEQICRTVVNTVANVGGIVCDGAKASCAAKIASSVEAAIMAHHMSMAGRGFRPGEGIVQDTIERTAQSLGHVGRVGMKQTDEEILKIMIDKVKFA